MGDKIEELQGYWQRQELPPRYDSPTQVKFPYAHTNKKGEAQAAGGAAVARWTGRWPMAGYGSSTQAGRT